MPEDIRIAIDSQRVMEAFERAPRAMVKQVRRFLSRGASEVARVAKDRAPKGFTTLTLTIRSKLDPFPALSGRVMAGGKPKNPPEGAPSFVSYARYVEEGTEPGGVPPGESLRAWIKVKRIEPRTPGMDQDDLIFLIQRKVMIGRGLQRVRDLVHLGLRVEESYRWKAA